METQLQWLSQLLRITIWRYAMSELVNENVIVYLEKSLMFFNDQTTYWTFILKILNKTFLHCVTSNSTIHKTPYPLTKNNLVILKP